MAKFTTVTVPGSRATAELARLRAEAATGRYPVLLGPPDEFEMTQEGMEEGFDPAKILKKATKLDGAKLLAGWRASMAPDDVDEESGFTTQPGEWPDDSDFGAGDADLSTPLDILTRKPHPKVLIGLFPVEAPWQVFAHLNWGSWNGCPGPAEHCALHRYWSERYGAEVVAVTHDVVECRVERPPQDRDGALALAWEQYIYCPDIVEQGTDTVARLAAGLLGAKTWYFLGRQSCLVDRSRLVGSRSLSRGTTVNSTCSTTPTSQDCRPRVFLVGLSGPNPCIR